MFESLRVELIHQECVCVCVCVCGGGQATHLSMHITCNQQAYHMQLPCSPIIKQHDTIIHT